MSYYGNGIPADGYQCNCVGDRCSGCGECCTDLLPVSTGEVKKIHEYLKTHPVKEHRQAPFFDLGAADLTCPFRDSVNKRCEIYPVRPLICRHFICTMNRETAHRERDKIYKGRNEVSFRKEFFDNPEAVNFIGVEMLKRLYFGGAK